MITEGSWFQAIIVVVGKRIYRRRVMLILEYISTHGTPEWWLRECQPGSPRVPYRRMSNSVHHTQACIGSTRGQCG